MIEEVPSCGDALLVQSWLGFGPAVVDVGSPHGNLGQRVRDFVLQQQHCHWWLNDVAALGVRRRHCNGSGWAFTGVQPLQQSRYLPTSVHRSLYLTIYLHPRSYYGGIYVGGSWIDHIKNFEFLDKLSANLNKSVGRWVGTLVCRDRQKKIKAFSLA